MTPEQNEIRTRWVAALRSGAYKQGRGFLHKDGKYCCLGVLCELAVKDGIIDNLGITDSGISYGRGTASSTKYLPKAVRVWSGVRASEGDYLGPTRSGADPHTPYRSLMRDNDATGKTFAEIASIIESEPDGLFIEPQPEGSGI